MPRMKPKTLSNPPSQPSLEGGLDSAQSLTSNTVASLRQPPFRMTDGDSALRPSFLSASEESLSMNVVGGYEAANHEIRMLWVAQIGGHVPACRR
jgi:hypothetical protein